MKSIFGIAIVVPLIAALSLILALPYFGVTVLAFITAPWFEVSDEMNRRVDDLLEYLPRRRTRYVSIENDTPINIALMVSSVVVMLLMLLALFRVQWMALKLSGFPTDRPALALLLPPASWWKIPGCALGAYLFLGYLAVLINNAETGTVLHLIHQPFSGSDLQTYYSRYGVALKTILFFAMLLFVPFGLSSMRNACTWRLPFGTFFRSSLTLLIVGVLYFALTMWITVLAANFLFVADTNPFKDVTGQAWFSLSFNTILFFAMMSSFSAGLLKQRLHLHAGQA